ncbi:MAG TPA: glycosyltransferase [Methylomirabilota bacterium]|nr:glycosyltransferase [Methylomirabilota bacterium]
MTPLNILHLAANRWWTGSADPIIQLARGFEERGHRVWLGCIRGDRFEQKALAAGLNLVDAVSLEVTPRPLRLFRDLRRLRAFCEEHAISVIHCHHSHDHWLGSFVRKGPGATRVLLRSFHNRRAVRRGLLGRMLYQRTDGCLAVSREIHARCIDAGIQPNKLWLIGGIVDLDRFSLTADGAPIRREFHLGDTPLIGSVARLAPNRGHELLLRAFQRLIQSIPQARLLLVGKGEARPSLEALVSQLGLTSHVLFTGYRDDDLPQLLAALNVFTLMGAGSDESCRAALEAMAVGTPVVARAVGALPETVIHGETGYLLDEEDSDQLSRLLRRLLENPESTRQMGRAGRRHVEAEFSHTRRVLQVEEIYQTLLERAEGVKHEAEQARPRRNQHEA